MLTAVAYYIEEPETPVKMLEIDARQAVARFPDQWSFKPWKAEPAPVMAPAASLEGPRRGPNANRS